MLVAPQVSYPGVYIQEVESDVRTIVGVETATTAFIGRARRGPVDTPVVCNSYADFETQFGGMWLQSTLGYAVRDFFLNGGAKAIVVRVYNPPTDPNDDGYATLQIGDGTNAVTLKATAPGQWGNELAAKVTYIATEDDFANNTNKAIVAKTVAAQMGLGEDAAKELFSLVIRDLGTNTTETINNITVTTGPRQIKGVLKKESSLVEVSSDLSSYPAATRPSLPTAVPTVSVGRWDENHTRATRGMDGATLTLDQILPNNGQANKIGLYALEKADIFNILCIPPFAGGASGAPDVPWNVWTEAAAYCLKRRAILLVDPPQAWKKVDVRDTMPLPEIGAHTNAALYFPRIQKPNPLRDNQVEEFVPCGTVAGVYARTDASRGVWKAPAGLDATLNGVSELSLPLTDAENGELNPLGINCLRKLPAAGNVVWGARTLVGDDRLANQWKYVPVRRTALFIEETIYRNIQWAVFEPNDEPLWSQLRLNIGVFMHGLFRQGAFQGQSPKDAYFVQCDSTTTTQADIDKGIVNVVVGFAPLKPAEFVVVYIKQITGELVA